MAAPTNTEKIHELRDKLASFEKEQSVIISSLSEQLNVGKLSLEQIKVVLSKLNEKQIEDSKTLAVLQSLLKAAESVSQEQLKTAAAVSERRLLEQKAELSTKITSLEERIKALELGSSRSWQVWLALLGASLALLVALLKK